jgi:uncharacterized protein (TIGR02246 family)
VSDVGCRVSGEKEVRVLAPGVAMLRAITGMILPGQQGLDPAANALQTLIAVEHGSEWRIALFQNTPAQFHGRRSWPSR